MTAWKCAGRYGESSGDWVIESDSGAFTILTEEEYQKTYGVEHGTVADGSTPKAL